MSDEPVLSPQAMLETHEFAAKALEEVTKRAIADGRDPGILHTAYMVTAAGWLANAFGPERASVFLRQLADQIAAEGDRAAH